MDNVWARMIFFIKFCWQSSFFFVKNMVVIVQMWVFPAKGQKIMASGFIERLGEIFRLDYSFDKLNHEQ